MARGRMIRVPKREQPIYDVLSKAFRDGVIYAFSYDGDKWWTWDTQHDWEGTFRRDPQRDGALTKRCGCEGRCEFKPAIWTTDEIADYLGLTLSGRRPQYRAAA